MADFNSSLPVKTQANGDVAVKVVDRTVTSQGMAVAADGSIAVTDNGSSLTVDGTVTVTQATGTNLHTVVDSGTLTNLQQLNGAAISMNTGVRDAGTQRVTIATNDVVPVTDNGGSLTVDNAGTFAVQATQSGTWIVQSNLRDEAGTAYSNSNPLPVAMVDIEGVEVNDYNTSAALGAGATSNHDYTTTSSFKFNQVEATASGKLKISIQIETAAASGVFNTVFIGFNSTARPDISKILQNPITVVSGAKVRVIRQNNDGTAQDVYSTISGFYLV